VGGDGCERHDTHLRWFPRRTCPGDPDKRRNLLEESCDGYSYRRHIRRRQAVPYRHSALGLRADPGPNGAVACGRYFARALAFDVVLAPAVEIAHTIAFRLTLTIAFAYGIPATLVIHVASAGLRPIGLRRPVRWGSRDSRHCLLQLFTWMAQDRPTADLQQSAN
jgi:hypothetical protein